MDIAIGMPGMIPGVSAATMRGWARRAEARGFATLICDERLVWDSYEILVQAAIAAAVTERIRVTTAVVLGPLRTNAALFAKQVASIDRLCEGRFVLGLGVGSRRDDFAASDVDFARRGRTMDALLERATAIWHGTAEPIGPRPARDGGPTILFGGSSDQVFRRIARYGEGWICATSGGIDGMRAGAARAGAEWEAAGRPGRPRILALAPRFALGPGAEEAVDGYLRSYNAYRGAGANDRAATALVTPDLVRAHVERFAAAGCDELVINPCIADTDQVDRLADALGQ